MATVAIVGDGPGGLSAALFLAKAGHETAVFGTDETVMRHAYLYNYLGIPEMSGSSFQTVARRQVAGFGADLRADRVESISVTDPGFTLTTESGEFRADYIVLSEGRNAALASALGLTAGDDGARVDCEYRSSLPGVYVVGRSARPTRSQAIISAGAGATAALDILAREAGKDVQDWDSPPEDDEG